MAAPITSCVPQDGLVSRLVQNIAETMKDEIPEQFLLKKAFPEAKDDPEFWKDSLLVDLSLLSSGDKQELSKFRSILSTWGGFLVKNHGIEESILEEMIKVSRGFFSLPFEEKMKYNSGEIFEGYDTDAVCQGLDQKEMNWNDRIFLIVHPKEKGNLNVWPKKPENFRDIVDEYSKNLKDLTEELYKAVAKSLNVTEDSFSLEKDGIISLRIAYYPKCPRPKDVLGSKPHCDGTFFTIVFADQEGLQVQNNLGQWFVVPLIPGTIFVNFGDFGEVLTNGIYKSTMHRVVTNPMKDRISLTTFCSVDISHELAPLKELVTETQPALYKNFIVDNYKNEVCCMCGPGDNAIDSFKIHCPNNTLS